MALPCLLAMVSCRSTEKSPGPGPAHAGPALERTCFQTGKAWSPQANLRSDVAIVYGIDADLPARIANLAGARLSHPRHDRRRVGPIPGLSLWPLRRDQSRGRGADRTQRPQDQPRRRRLLHVSRHELRQIPLRRRAARARCRRRSDPSGGAGVLGSRRLFGRVQARMAQLLSRGVAAARQLGGRPLAGLQAEIFSLSPRPAAGVRLRPGFTISAPAAKCVAMCRRTACSITPSGASSAPNPAWPSSTAATATSPRFGPAPRATPNRFAGRRASRTFETAFLEYGAMQNLVRATGRSRLVSERSD